MINMHYVHFRNYDLSQGASIGLATSAICITGVKIYFCYEHFGNNDQNRGALIGITISIFLQAHLGESAYPLKYLHWMFCKFPKTYPVIHMNFMYHM